MSEKLDNRDNPASKICEIRSTGMNVFEGMGGHVRPSNRVDSTMATCVVCRALLQMSTYIHTTPSKITNKGGKKIK